MVIDPSIGMLPVSCEQLLSLAGLFHEKTAEIMKILKNSEIRFSQFLEAY